MLNFGKVTETFIFVYVKKSCKDIKKSRIRIAKLVNSKTYLKISFAITFCNRLTTHFLP